MKTDPVQHLTGWDPFILQWKLIEEFPFVEILVSELLCGQPKNHIAIRAYDVLAVFAGSANVFQISATSYGLHDRKHQHHCFGANPLPSSSASVLIAFEMLLRTLAFLSSEFIVCSVAYIYAFSCIYGYSRNR